MPRTRRKECPPRAVRHDKHWRIYWVDREGRQRWRAADGQRRKFTTKSAAQKYILQHPELGQSRARDDAAPTFQQVFDDWIAARRAGRVGTEESQARNHFAELADRPIDEITPADVRRWVAGRIDSGLAPRSVKDVLSLVGRIFRVAMAEEILMRNPADPAFGISSPPTPRKPLGQGDVFTPAELERLIELAPRRWRAVIAFRGELGTRWSEAIAIRPVDLNLLRRTVHVGHRVVVEQRGPLHIRETGKTPGSDRDITMSKRLVRILEDHLQEYPARPEEAVFRTESGGFPSRANFNRRIWKPTLRRLGREMIENFQQQHPDDEYGLAEVEYRVKQIQSIHNKNLRHTAAARMLSEGMAPIRVMANLGHRSSRSLDVYMRLVPPQVGQQLAEQIEQEEALIDDILGMTRS